MAYTSLPTVTPGAPTRASWGNLVDTNLDDHEARIGDLETATIGTGDVVGPASATADAPALFDGTTGKLLKAGTPFSLAGAGTYLSFAAQVLTRTLIDLAAHVTGRLPWANVAAAPAANRLVGRGSSGGAGDWEPIALGAGLSMSGSTLSASGGGGGASELDDLSDVIVATPAVGHMLHHTGTEWVNTEAPRVTRLGIGAAADASGALRIAGHYWSDEYDAGTSGTSKTINWNDGNTQLLEMDDDCTLTLSNPKAGGRYLLVIDNAGGHVTTLPASVKWSGGVAADLDEVGIHILTLAFSAVGSGIYLAAANLDFS